MKGCDKSYTHPSSLRKHIRMHEMQQQQGIKTEHTEQQNGSTPTKQPQQQQQPINSTFRSNTSSSSSSANTSRNSFTESPPSYSLTNATNSYQYSSSQYNPYSYQQQSQHIPAMNHAASYSNQYNQFQTNYSTLPTTSTSPSSSIYNQSNSFAQQHLLNYQTEHQSQSITPLKLNNYPLQTNTNSSSYMINDCQVNGQQQQQHQSSPITNLNDWYMYQNQHHNHHGGILTPPSNGSSPLVLQNHLHASYSSSIPSASLNQASSVANTAAHHHRVQALAHCTS